LTVALRVRIINREARADAMGANRIVIVRACDAYSNSRVAFGKWGTGTKANSDVGEKGGDAREAVPRDRTGHTDSSAELAASIYKLDIVT
jgi:hypothetical protein